MARLRPSEVKTVVGLLEQDWDDVEELARTICRTLDDARESRKEYVVVTLEPQGLVQAWGTFATVKEAEREIGGFVQATQEGAKAVLTILHRHPDSDDEEVLF